MSRQKKRQAQQQLLTLDHRARQLGLNKNQYLLYRMRDNLQQWIGSTPVNILVALLILFSVVLIIIEFLLPPGRQYETVHHYNDVVTWIFVVELSLRYLVAPNKRIFFSNYWIDILSVLPVLRVFRTLRLLRLLRVLRLARATMFLMRDSGWLSQRIERYFGNFGFLFLTSVTLIICASIALVSLERLNLSSPVSIQTFIDKIWMTTFLFISGEVIGEMPITAGGKVVAVLISVAGLVVFAVMVGTISASMTAFFRTKMDAKDMEVADLKDHLIICGWDRKAPLILHELEAVTDLWRRGIVVVSERQEDIFAECEVKNKRRLFHIKDDFTKVDVLELAGAKYARTALVLADHTTHLSDQDRDARTVLAALTLEKINPGIFTCAELLNEKNATHLKIAGVDEIISRTTLSAGLFASSAINEGISPIISDILTHREGSYFKKLDVPKDFVGKPFLEVYQHFKSEYDAMVIAIESPTPQGRFEHHVNPAKTHLIKADDRLTIIIKRDSAICELT